MKRAAAWLALAALLLAAPSWAQSRRSPAIAAFRVMHTHEADVAKQRAAVQRLQDEVVAQEAGSHTATEKLKQKDAEIAELQRQLQATRTVETSATRQH